jgi:hypothetical protein
VLTVGGLLVPHLEDSNKKSFLGIGFGAGGVPIDIVPIYQLTALLPDCTLLIVDEFLGINGVDESVVHRERGQLVATLNALEKVYGMPVKREYCSEFMGTDEYVELFSQLNSEIRREGLEGAIEFAIPMSKRNVASACEYPVHELACVKYLSARGFTQKIGPSKEIVYDRIMSLLGFQMSFGCLLEAYALGTKSADVVVHYVPRSRGPNNGQRIF